MSPAEILQQHPQVPSAYSPSPYAAHRALFYMLYRANELIRSEPVCVCCKGYWCSDILYPYLPYVPVIAKA